MYEISLRYKNTLRLAGIAIVWGVALGLLIGIWAGVHRGKWQDYTGMTVSIAGQAIPNFWIGLMLIVVFAVKLKWFPVTGAGTWRHLVLPVITLGTGLSATIARFTRSSIIEVLKSDDVTKKIIQNMISNLKELEKAYPKNVQIKEENNE